MGILGRMRADHLLLDRVASALEAHARALEAGAEVERHQTARFVDFLSRYVEGVHHAREERLLFAPLVRAGLARESEIVTATVTEHTILDQLLDELHLLTLPARPWSRQERAIAAAAAAQYAHFTRGHIAKEERILDEIAARPLPSGLGATIDARLRAEQVGHEDEERELLRLGEALAAAA